MISSSSNWIEYYKWRLPYSVSHLFAFSVVFCRLGTPSFDSLRFVLVATGLFSICSLVFFLPWSKIIRNLHGAWVSKMGFRPFHGLQQKKSEGCQRVSCRPFDALQIHMLWIPRPRMVIEIQAFFHFWVWD